MWPGKHNIHFSTHSELAKRELYRGGAGQVCPTLPRLSLARQHDQQPRLPLLQQSQRPIQGSGGAFNLCDALTRRSLRNVGQPELFGAR